MGFSNGTPTISTDGLVFAIDAGNGQSYVSGSTTCTSLVSSVTGSLTNGVGFSSSNQGSWDFDGANDYVNIDGVQASLSATTTGTWSCWVKPVDATPSVAGTFIAIGDTDAASYLYFHITATSGLLEIQGKPLTVTSLRLQTDVSPFTDNTWTHIAVTQDGSNPVLYADGVAVAQTFLSVSDKGAWLASDSNFDNGRIGVRDFNSSETSFFNGNMSNVQIYNKALTASEVTQNYNATKNRFI
jgi:hypothetical protein